jgi:DNA segregation ATPase FtsK/SpoIIIE, S-DNA-T family
MIGRKNYYGAQAEWAARLTPAAARRELQSGAGQSLGLVLAGDADRVCSGFSGWQIEAKKARRGLLLSPQNITDADLIGVRVPRTYIGQPIQPGRGVLHLGGGNPLVVQVPFS